MILGAAAIVGAFAWAPLLGRLRGGRGPAVVMTVVAVGAVLPLLSVSVGAAMGSAMLFGGSFLTVVTAVTTIAKRSLPPHHWTRAIAALTVVFAVFQCFGPVLAGALSDAAGGLRMGLGLSAAVVASGAMVALAQRHREAADADGVSGSPPTTALRPVATLHFEDFAPGQVYELGAHTVTTEEIVGFARAWDPQRFHLDPVQASRTPFKGLIASGWHTASVFMSLYVAGLLADCNCVGSPGVDELRWLAPVRPGDTLFARLTVKQVVPSSSRADRGTVYPLCELRNQDGSVVFTMVLRTLLMRRA